MILVEAVICIPLLIAVLFGGVDVALWCYQRSAADKATAAPGGEEARHADCWHRA
jgi:Flp pilus assembly protein TadG